MKTYEDAMNDFNKELKILFKLIAKKLYIYKILDWLNKKLK